MPAGSTADGSPNFPSEDNDASHDPTLQQEASRNNFHSQSARARRRGNLRRESRAHKQERLSFSPKLPWCLCANEVRRFARRHLCVLASLPRVKSFDSRS